MSFTQKHYQINSNLYTTILLDILYYGWRALVNAVMNLRVPQNSGKLSSVVTTRDLSSSAQLHGVSYQVEEDEMGRACSTNGEKRNAY
jgi:hypothetical protein